MVGGPIWSGDVMVSRAAVWRAFGVGVLGIALFACMDAMMKGLVLTIGLFAALLWRGLASVVVSGALYAVTRPALPGRAALVVHATRGAVGAVMVVLFFWGLARIPMAQAVALTFVAPLLSIGLAAVLLGERVGRRAMLSSLVALAGVAIILAGQWRAEMMVAAHAGRVTLPGGGAALRGSAAVLASALCYAFNIVLMRRQALVSGPVEVAFSQSLIVTALLAAGGAVLWVGGRIDAVAIPDPRQAAVIAMAAVLAVASLMLLAWAYARGAASVLSTGEYTAFIWAAALGWAVFGERVSIVTLMGAGLIVAGCVQAGWRTEPGMDEMLAG